MFVKVTDMYLFILAGSIPECPDNMNEALTIGIYFPLLTLGLISSLVHGSIGKHAVSAAPHLLRRGKGYFAPILVFP